MTKQSNIRAENLFDWLENHIKLITAFFLSVYFAFSFSQGLLKGGRWDLYQAIATADRFLSGKGFYYSAVEASTPYFPGVSFLAVVIGKLFYPWRDYILLFIASAIGALFSYILIYLGGKVTKNKWIPLCIAAYAAFLAFPSYRSYMKEFKADSLVMIFAFLIILIIDRIETNSKKISIVTLTEIFLISFMMDVTKQQALYVNIGIGMYLLFSKSIALKNRIVLLIPIISGGILALCVIFSIPNIAIQTIKNLSAMPYWDLKNIVLQMGVCFIINLPFFILFFYFIFLFACKRVRLDKLNTKWLIVSLCMGLGQIIGGMKLGGNAGNYEAGMICFLPFTIMSANVVFEEYIASKNKRKLTAMAMLCTLALTFAYLAWGGITYMKAVDKISNDNVVSEYLSENFEGETIMYYSDNYMQVIRSSVVPGMDVYSTPHNMMEYWHSLDETLKKQTYKYLYINPTNFEQWDQNKIKFFKFTTHNIEYLNEFYEMIDEPDMPEALKGQLFKAK